MRKYFAVLLLSQYMVLVAAQPQENTASITGTVLDEATGLAVPRVQLLIKSGTGTTFSDENGRFSLQRLPSGLSLIETRRSGYEPARMRERKLPGNSGIPVELKPGQRLERTIYISRAPVLTGRVIDTQGGPLQGVRVVPYRLVFGSTGTVVQQNFSSSTTDDLGVYRLTDLEAGDYFVKFETPAIQRITDSSPLFYSIYYPGSTDEQGAIKVFLEHGVEHRLSDTVLRSAAGGVLSVSIASHRTVVEKGSALLYLKRRNSSGFAQSISMNLPAKSVALARLAPGTYDVEAYAPVSSGKGKATFEVSDTDISVDIFIKERVTVSGFVSLAGRAVSGVELHLTESFGLRTPDIFFVSDKDGKLGGGNSTLGVFEGIYEFRVTNIPAGLYVADVIAARTQGNQIVFDDNDARPIIEVRLDEHPAMIEGRVYDSSGRAVIGGVVALVPDDAGQSNRLVSSTTDAFGHYELHAAPGEYRIYSWKELDGSAYRSAQFIEPYYGRSQALRIGRGERQPNVDLQTLD